MLSEKAREVARKFNESRVRVEKAKDDVLELARTVVFVLKGQNKELADELERRIFVVDSEMAAGVKAVLPGPEALDGFIELITRNRE